MKQAILILSITALLLQSCGSGRKTQNEQPGETPLVPVAVPQQGYMVYKTKGDYYNLVPVQLTEDKTGIVSYPAVSDLRRGGEFTYPIKLADGYLLDRRGIGPNTAFLELSYESFFEIGGAPPTSDLKGLVHDDDPFLELYSCLTRIEESAVIEYVNGLIQSGELSNQCIRIR
jgi:hypothetical protein